MKGILVGFFMVISLSSCGGGVESDSTPDRGNNDEVLQLEFDLDAEKAIEDEVSGLAGRAWVNSQATDSIDLTGTWLAIRGTVKQSIETVQDEYAYDVGPEEYYLEQTIEFDVYRMVDDGGTVSLYSCEFSESEPLFALDYVESDSLEFSDDVESFSLTIKDGRKVEYFSLDEYESFYTTVDEVRLHTRDQTVVQMTLVKLSDVTGANVAQFTKNTVATDTGCLHYSEVNVTTEDAFTYTNRLLWVEDTAGDRSEYETPLFDITRDNGIIDVIGVSDAASLDFYWDN